jgi:hypothetical protein
MQQEQHATSTPQPRNTTNTNCHATERASERNNKAPQNDLHDDGTRPGTSTDGQQTA